MARRKQLERNNQWLSDDTIPGHSLRDASVRGGAATMASQGCKFVLQLGSMFLLGRLLTPADFGLVAMVTALTAFVLLFKESGLSTATIQQPRINHQQVNSLFWVNAAISFLAMLATMALAPVVAWFYKEPRLTAIVAVSAVGLLVGGLGVQHQALLSRRLRFKSLAIADTVSTLLAALAAVAAALAGLRYWALVIMQITLLFSYSLSCWIACAWRPSMPGLHPEALPMLRFGKSLTGFSILNYFARNLDNVLIGHVWGPVQLGFYAKAYQLLLLPLAQLNTPMQSVALPALSRLQHDPERYRAAYISTIRLLAFVTMAMTGYLLVAADWLIPFLLGPQWRPAVGMYRWLAITGLLQPIANSTGWLFMSQGRGRDMFRWSIISTSLIVTAILAALPFGATAVAASYSLTTALLVSPILFWFVTRRGPVRMGDIYATLWLPAFATAAAATGVQAFRIAAPILTPLPGIAVTVPLWTMLFLGALACIPSGRAALREIEALVRTRLPSPLPVRPSVETSNSPCASPSS